MASRYVALGPEAEFEPGSRGRVLRNLLGNGRCARLLAYLMALQAGLPSLDFMPLAGRGKRGYIAAIQAAVSGNYEPLAARFSAVIERTLLSFGERQ